MNPVNSISDILEHTPEGHEEVSIFKPCFTAVRRKRRDHSGQSQQVRSMSRRETVQNAVQSLCFHLTIMVSYLLLYHSSDFKEVLHVTQEHLFKILGCEFLNLHSSTTAFCDCNSYFSPTVLQEGKKTGTVQFAVFYKRWMALIT